MWKSTRLFLSFVAWVSGVTALSAQAGDLASLVDTRIGTAPSPSAIKGADGEKIGNTQPAAVAPFGMVQWGPDTRRGSATNYLYSDSQILGFSLTHLSGPGCASTGELSILPFIGKNGPLSFSHEQELAQAGHYSVTSANGIQVELSATPRTGVGRLSFPAGSDASIAIDFVHTGTGKHDGQLVQTTDAGHFQGWVEGGNFCGTHNRYRVYFSIALDQPAQSVSISNGVAVLKLDPSHGPRYLLKVGLSYVSAANADLNLRTESSAGDFESTRVAASAEWEALLGRVVISGGSDSERRAFYTALYHSLLHPNVISDVDGSYLGFDQKPHHARDEEYANFSGWDIYRTEIQWLALFAPSRASQIAQSLVDAGTQCGAMPKWAQNNDDTGVMVGDPGPAIVANAYAYGARDFDQPTAFALMTKSSLRPKTKCNRQEIRPALADELKHHYVPLNYSFLSSFANQSASMTLEYAYADFAISRFAQAQGNDAVAQELLVHAGYWRNLFDPSTHLIRPRDSDGLWLTPFDSVTKFGFTEGNAAQYSWMVPFDVGGLVDLLGGRAIARTNLDAFVSQLNAWRDLPNLWIGNEPSFNAPWIYNWLGSPSQTYASLSRILAQSFNDTPGGLPGNDDLGATSSWSIWATLGLYPAIPGTDDLILTAPHFPSIEIHLENGTTVRFTRAGEAAGAIESVSLNQVPWIHGSIPWSKLRDGGDLHFSLGADHGWASSTADFPPSGANF